MNTLHFEYWCDYYQKDLNILYKTYLNTFHGIKCLKKYLNYTQFSYLVYKQSKKVYLQYIKECLKINLFEDVKNFGMPLLQNFDMDVWKDVHNNLLFK